MRFRSAGEITLRASHPFGKVLEEKSFHFIVVSLATWAEFEKDLNRLLARFAFEGPVEGFKKRRPGRVPERAYYFVVKQKIPFGTPKKVMSVTVYFFEHQGTIEGLMRDLHVMEVMES